MTLTAYGVDGDEYDLLTDSQKLKIQSLFIYGVALHDLTDTFAHASFAEKNGNIVPIVHHDDDTEEDHLLGSA